MKQTERNENQMSENLSSPIPPDIDHIRELIAEISNQGKEQLDQHMKKLKKALLENPSAANLILPQEIGLMVRALKEMEGKIIIDAKNNEELKKQKRLAKSKQVDKDVNTDPQAVLADLDEM